MYIHGLIPQNFVELAEAVTIVDNICKQFGLRSSPSESKLFDTLICSRKNFLKKLILKKSQQTTTKACKELNFLEIFYSKLRFYILCESFVVYNKFNPFYTIFFNQTDPLLATLWEQYNSVKTFIRVKLKLLPLHHTHIAPHVQ